MRIYLALLLVAAACLSAQDNPKEAREDSAIPKQPTFSTHVELVVVPVVVRDGKGQAVGNLKKEDFQLFDKGKLQSISRFSMENTGSEASVPAATTAVARVTPTTLPSPTTPSATPSVAPTRFVVYLFDDLHIDYGDLAPVRDATIKHLKESIHINDRVAILTTSGHSFLDFTADREQMIETVKHIMLRPLLPVSPSDCPPVDFYQSILIQNRGDQAALSVATADYIHCSHLNVNGKAVGGLDAAARAAAGRVLGIGEADLKNTLVALKEVVRRLSTAPGQRSIVLISPGFLVTDRYRQDNADLMDRAVRARVVISGLNSRGLMAPGGMGPHFRYEAQAAIEEDVTLSEISSATGGILVHNTNGFGEGLNRIAEPQFIYLLGFAPDNLKYDGSFHSVKVDVKGSGLSAQARPGYYSPLHPENKEERAKRNRRNFQ